MFVILSFISIENHQHIEGLRETIFTVHRTYYDKSGEKLLIKNFSFERDNYCGVSYIGIYKHHVRYAL